MEEEKRLYEVQPAPKKAKTAASDDDEELDSGDDEASVEESGEGDDQAVTKASGQQHDELEVRLASELEFPGPSWPSATAAVSVAGAAGWPWAAPVSAWIWPRHHERRLLRHASLDAFRSSHDKGAPLCLHKGRLADQNIRGEVKRLHQLADHGQRQRTLFVHHL